MVQVRLPKGVNAKSLGGSVDWSKSYYYLTLDPIKGWFGSAAPISNLNFPLQFDHHIYLDPNHSNYFYLKVKGIPFDFLRKFQGKTAVNNVDQYADQATTHLQKGNSDYIDYLHNRMLVDDGSGHAKEADPLDKLNGDDNTGYSDNNTTTDSNGVTQPRFIQQGQTGKNETVWDPYAGLIDDFFGDLSWKFLWWTIPYGQLLSYIFSGQSTSPVYESGSTGRTIALLNASAAADDRGMTSKPTDGGFFGTFFDEVWKWYQGTFITPIVANFVKYFSVQGFQGNAHINFSFDMAKYDGDTDPLAKALTKGQMMPAPYQDGEFNHGNGTGTTQATDTNRSGIGITMYGSDQLVDPYSVLPALASDRVATGMNNSLRKKLQAGITPIDYAVINKSAIDNNAGTNYPVYTNFKSWTAAVVPFDRNSHDALYDTDAYKDTTDKDSGTGRDTLHSSGTSLASDTQYRTASPDPFLDGVLINNGQSFGITKSWDNSDYAPLKASDGALTKAGGVTPQRYAKVFQYYDYSDPNNPQVKPHQIFTDSSNQLSVQADTANVNGPTYTGNVAKSLDGQKWHYTGSVVNSYKDATNTPQTAKTQLSDADLNLSQPINPELDLNIGKTIMLNESQVAGTKTVNQELGTWRDPLRITGQEDTMKMNLTSTQGTSQNASTDALTGNTDKHPVNSTFGSSLTAGMQVGKTGTVSSQFQVPPINDSSHFFLGKVDLSRNYDVPIAAGPSQSVTLPKGTASTNSQYFIIWLNNHTPDVAWYDMKKYFIETDGTQDTTHFLKTGADAEKQVKVGGTATNNGKDGGNNYQSTINLQLPKMNGLAIGNVQATEIHGSQTIGTATVTHVADSTVVGNYLDTWQLKLPQPLADGYSITYTYEYTGTGTGGVIDPTQVDMGAALHDQMMGQDQMLGYSNGVQFSLLKAVNITTVPDFNFGKHPLPTAKQTYNLDGVKTAANGAIDPTSAQALLTNQQAILGVQDNVAATGGYKQDWNIIAQVSPFMSADNQQTLAAFGWHWGIPWHYDATTKTWSQDQDPDPSTDWQHLVPADQWTAAQSAYHGHMGLDLVTNNQAGTLSNYSYSYEPDTNVTPLLIGYPGAQLTYDPQTMPTVQNGKYQSTVTYTLSSSGATLN